MRAALALAPLLLSACGLIPGVSGPAAPLEGSAWTARALPGTSGPVPVPAAQTLSVAFGPGGQLTGQADCNRLFGRYTATPPATLAVRDLGQTRMFCGAGSLGDAFLQALTATRSYAVVGGTLTLRTDTGGLVVLERDTPAPASALVGTEWKAATVVANGAAQAVPEGQPLTLVLGADGQAGGMAHCNRYGGPYTRDGAALRFGELMSTRMFCGAGSLDVAFLDALRRTRTFTLDGATLTLHADTGPVATFAR